LHADDSRFGKWTTFKSNAPTYQGVQNSWGDVYFDLFQDGNFNFKEGNKEAIWNIEQDPNILGGNNTDVNTSGGFFRNGKMVGTFAMEY
jgi:hypothetical protein